MADESQLEILREGVEAWDEWLEGEKYYPEVDLSGANLRDADLEKVWLVGADLSGADLSRANLRLANLSAASLAGAKLSGANLNLAYLYETGLDGADLSGANLIRTNLTDAFLGECNFSTTIFEETVLSNVDLSCCKGLELISHKGPSPVDIRTLQWSSPLPLVFLRGVGLPDTLIDYLPSLLNQSIQLYSCFTSYSSKDEDFEVDPIGWTGIGAT